MGTRYIVKRKGLFGTLYIASPSYTLYPSTTTERNRAYRFGSFEKAEKIAQKIFGEVIEIEYKEEGQLPTVKTVGL